MIFSVLVLLAIYLQSVSIINTVSKLFQGISKFKGAINVMARTGHDTAEVAGRGLENEELSKL